MDNARLYEQAQRAIRVRDQFLSMAAHELKTPVTSILGYAQMLHRRLERGETTGERNIRAVQTLSDQTRRLHQLVNSLFDLSRIQLGQLSLERKPVDVPRLVHDLVDTLLPTLNQHVITYVDTIPLGTLIIEVDALRLEQAVLNLIQNAIKYSPSGGAIDVAVERQAQHVCIRVSDQGMGIPTSALTHLFRRFYRADNVQETHISGMGVGLYIVKEIITLHGGTIEVESREGQGSTFRLLLPLH
jgi:signal transduction histidine kinase